MAFINEYSQKDSRSTYAHGSFRKSDHAFIPGEFTKPSPFGSRLASFNSDYTVLIAPDGSGFSFSGEVAMTSGDARGKQWSIRDKETNSTWTPFTYDSDKDHSEYSVEYVPGSATIISISDKIASSITIATSNSGNYELWLVKLQNLSAKDRYLTFDTYVCPYSSAKGEITLSESGKLMVLTGDAAARNLGWKDGVLFFASTLKPSRYYTSTARFFTTGGDFDPDQSSLIEDSPVLGVSLDIELPIEGEALIGFCFGRSEDIESSESICESHQGTEWITREIDEIRKQWLTAVSITTCNSDDINFDALTTTWLPYEILTEWLSAHSIPDCFTSSSQLESLRLITPFAAVFGEHLKSEILHTTKKMVAAGLYSHDGKSITAMPPVDTIWLPYAVAVYFIETANSGFLNNPVEYQNLSRGTVLDISLRELNYYLEQCKKNSIEVHPETDLTADTLRGAAGLPERSKDIILPDQDNKACSECDLINHICSMSPILASGHQNIAKWMRQDMKNGEILNLLSLYQGICSGILGITKDTCGIHFNPSIHNAIITHRFRELTYVFRTDA